MKSSPLSSSIMTTIIQQSEEPKTLHSVGVGVKAFSCNRDA
jgi:hypothetical protein